MEVRSGMRRVMLSGAIILACAAGATAQIQPEYDMGKMQMVFLSRSTEWKPKDSADKTRIEKNHRDYITDLIKTGKCALEGTVPADDFLYEILVFKTESIDEARSLVNAFPGVKAGMLKTDVVSWYAARNFILRPDDPIVQSHYIFGLLLHGPNWTAEQTDQSRRIQAGHMANINRLAELGKLVLAGPFFDGGEKAGVFIFKVDSIEEAKGLTDSDPAVIAGRLKIELHHWSVPRGMLK